MRLHDWLKRVGGALFVAACVPHPVPMDINRAQLMPEPAAKTVIAKIIPSYGGGADLQLGPKVQPIKGIRHMMLYRDDKLVIEGLAETMGICDATLDDARQLAEAFAALGAAAFLDRTDDINPWVSCSLTLRH